MNRSFVFFSWAGLVAGLLSAGCSSSSSSAADTTDGGNVSTDPPFVATGDPLSAQDQTWTWIERSEEHTSELQSHSDLHSFPTRRSSDLLRGGYDRRGQRQHRSAVRRHRGSPFGAGPDLDLDR